MSKSYTKVKKFGICTGTNTEFYRDRRHLFRAKDKQAIRDTLAHADVSEFDYVYAPVDMHFKDDWTEPTDGTFVRTAKGIEEYYPDGFHGVYTTKDGKIKK